MFHKKREGVWTKNGIQPAREFILSQEKKFIAKTLDMIQLLQDNGYQLREPYSKALENGIFELRIKFGNNISRIMYFFYVDQHIILTNGFIKKTQKTPRNEIEALQPEHTVIQAMIDARKKSGMTQKELAEITGIAQGDISKLERGSANPSIRTLQRLAKGMGMILKIEFTPEQVSVVK